jgi:hypothetical protein
MRAVESGAMQAKPCGMPFPLTGDSVEHATKPLGLRTRWARSAQGFGKSLVGLLVPR